MFHWGGFSLNLPRNGQLAHTAGGQGGRRLLGCWWRVSWHVGDDDTVVSASSQTRIWWHDWLWCVRVFGVWQQCGDAPLAGKYGHQMCIVYAHKQACLLWMAAESTAVVLYLRYLQNVYNQSVSVINIWTSVWYKMIGWASQSVWYKMIGWASQSVWYKMIGWASQSVWYKMIGWASQLVHCPCQSDQCPCQSAL